ncbi:MAG: hypothetical protein R6V50_06030 [Thermoplasmatota archaeon]
MKNRGAETINTKPDDIVNNLLTSIVQVIGRRSSEDYGLVMLENVIKKLQQSYDFLNYIEVNSNQFNEMKKTIIVDPLINNVPVEDLRKSLQEILKQIVVLMGNNAGFFFIKEINQTLGYKYRVPIRQFGIDLDYLQINIEVEKKQKKIPTIDYSNLFHRVLKTLLSIMDDEIGREEAVHILKKILNKFQNKYDFFKDISYIDLRYTFGENEISIDQNINTKQPVILGQSIEDIITEVYRSLAEYGKFFDRNHFFRQLTGEYRQKLEELGVTLNKSHIRNTLLFTKIIDSLISVISHSHTKKNAALMMNSFLRALDQTYDFLKNVTVQTDEHNQHFDIHISETLDDVSETNMRRSIQKIIEKIMANLGEDEKNKFIDEFTQALDKNSLLRMEEIGVNLHIIQLRYNVFSRSKNT